MGFISAFKELINTKQPFPTWK